MLEKTAKIINLFKERFVDNYFSAHGEFEEISSEYDYHREHDTMVKFVFFDDIEKEIVILYAWLDEGTDCFHVANKDGIEFTDLPEENGLSRSDVNYIKYGKRLYLITEIRWADDDNENIILPTELDLPEHISPDDNDAINDYLSDLTGFLCENYSVEEVD